MNVAGACIRNKRVLNVDRSCEVMDDVPFDSRLCVIAKLNAKEIRTAVCSSVFKVVILDGAAANFIAADWG